MVCNRCVMTVGNELQLLGHTPVQVSLGEATYLPLGTASDLVLEERLSAHGFDVLKEKQDVLTGEVLDLIAQVYSGDFDFPDRFRFSEHVQRKLLKSYETIADAFIATRKMSIEKYIIEFRINKVKELLVYDDLKLADIAFKLNFSSVAHLSAQFKQQTGLTPSYFRSIKLQREERHS